ncbi:MAG: hypothetical protein IJR22_04325 [Acidaminococcaceae bacterium]|nr:hypothetical protein [Acidaminococcaceae bacterium]
MNDIKNYRKNELKSYVILHILAFMYCHDSFLLGESISKITMQTFIDGNLKNLVNLILPLSATYVYIFILDAIVPSEMKRHICNACYAFENSIVLLFKFLGRPVNKLCKPLVDKLDKLGKQFIDVFCIPLPEETVFDDIKNDKLTDKRFTIEEAQIKYQWEIQQLNGSEGYERKRKSKSMWHSIYAKYEKEVTVLITYRDYLLCRDLCVITLLMIISYASFLLYLHWYCKLQYIELKLFCFLIFEMLVATVATRVKQERLVCNVISTDIHLPRKILAKPDAGEEVDA